MSDQIKIHIPCSTLSKCSSLQSKINIYSKLQKIVAQSSISTAKIGEGFSKLSNHAYSSEFYCTDNLSFPIGDEDVKVELCYKAWNRQSYYLYLYKTLEAEIDGSIFSIDVYYNAPEARNGNRVFGKRTYRSELKFFPLFHSVVPRLHDTNKKIIRKAILRQFSEDGINVDKISGIIPKDIQNYFNFT